MNKKAGEIGIRKKYTSLTLLSLITLSIFIGFTSATQHSGLGSAAEAGAEAGEFANAVGEALGQFFLGLVGQTFFSDTGVLTNLFLAVLLGMVVYSVLKMTGIFGASKTITWIASIAVTVLSLIAIPDGFLSAIVVQYGVMGATLLSIIPLLIIFTFTLKVENLLVARLTWVFYVFYYFGIFAFKAWETFREAGYIFSLALIPYLVSIAVGIVAYVILKPLRHWVATGEIEAKEEKLLENVEKRKLNREIALEHEKNVADAQ